MTERFRYGVLGAGRQGTAAAFDLAVRGDADVVHLADASEEAARASADRVNGLAGAEIARASIVDAGDEDAIRAFLEPLDAAVVAVPHRFVLGASRAALAAGTSVC